MGACRKDKATRRASRSTNRAEKPLARRTFRRPPVPHCAAHCGCRTSGDLGVTRCRSAFNRATGAKFESIYPSRVAFGGVSHQPSHHLATFNQRGNHASRMAWRSSSLRSAAPFSSWNRMPPGLRLASASLRVGASFSHVPPARTPLAGGPWSLSGERLQRTWSFHVQPPGLLRRFSATVSSPSSSPVPPAASATPTTPAPPVARPPLFAKGILAIKTFSHVLHSVCD